MADKTAVATGGRAALSATTSGAEDTDGSFTDGDDTQVADESRQMIKVGLDDDDDEDDDVVAKKKIIYADYASSEASHVVLGVGGNEQSAFDITGDLSTPFSSTQQHQLTVNVEDEDDAQLLQPQPEGGGKTIDDDGEDSETSVGRRIRIAWLIAFGSVTSIFCFPIGVAGLVLAVLAWLYETAQLTSINCCRSKSTTATPMSADRRRHVADRLAKVSLIVSLVGVGVGVVVAIVFIVFGLVWTENSQQW